MYRKLLSMIVTLLMVVVGSGCSRPEPSAPIQPVSEETSWTIGETTVYATITHPDREGRYPAVVFVAGSGPTDRNWNSPLLQGTNGSARLLAEELARQGLVTLRYDKRFTGPKAQENLPFLKGKISLEGHVEELAGALDQLLARTDVDREHIYVLANSEGTIHALNYQMEREPKFAGLVLAAPPGHPMVDVIHSQIAAQVAPLPNATEIMAGFDRLMDDFLAGRQFSPETMLPEGLNNLVLSLNQPANLPFGREILTVDPAALLSRVTVPVLVIIGKKDIQVDWQTDGALLEAASVSHRDATFIYPQNANHVLKYEPKSRAELTAASYLNYNVEDRMLDPETLEAIQTWLASQR